ncbi:MAG: H-type small acid-soluble spore protein [Clostridia bacterium]|nr:H-type small acid-soluble spore protein [Clostridia bacterium]
MDSIRARQIINSNGVIEVKHKNSSVWLENIRGENAEVTYLESKKRAEVPLNQLSED